MVEAKNSSSGSIPQTNMIAKETGRMEWTFCSQQLMSKYDQHDHESPQACCRYWLLINSLKWKQVDKKMSEME